LKIQILWDTLLCHWLSSAWHSEESGTSHTVTQRNTPEDSRRINTTASTSNFTAVLLLLKLRRQTDRHHRY